MAVFGTYSLKTAPTGEDVVLIADKDDSDDLKTVEIRRLQSAGTALKTLVDYDGSLIDAVAGIGATITTLIVNETPDALTADLTIPSTLHLEWASNCILGTDLSIRNATYKWTASGSGTNEYYLELAAGGDPGISEPSTLAEDDTILTIATAGSLAVSEWDWADNDTLGYSTVYVRLSDSADPDSKAADFVEAGYTLTINGDFEAGYYQAFSGNGVIEWVFGAKINQLWFGTDNDAMHFAARGLVADSIWFLPNSTYYLSTKLEIPAQIKILGEEKNRTIISSTVSGDYTISIVQDGAIVRGAMTEISNLRIYGGASSTVGSNSTGGLYMEGVYWATLDNVHISNFASDGYNTNTPGNQTTELRAGLYMLDIAYSKINNSLFEKNDVGLRFNISSKTINTSTHITNVSSQQNRTHAVLFNEIMTVWWDGGVIESNRGLVTFKAVNVGSYKIQGFRLANLHFEANQVDISYPGVGSRDLYIDGNLDGQVSLSNLNGLMGEHAVELVNIKFAQITECLLGLTPGSPLKVDSTCDHVLIACTRANSWSYMVDDGEDTKIISEMTSIGEGDVLTGATPSVTSNFQVTLPSGTITDFTGGSKGQLLICEAVDGTILSGANFLLKNGNTYMSFAASSKFVLKYTGSVWEMLWHISGSDGKDLENAATVNVRDGEVYYVGDSNTTDINTINLGYNNQRITIISEHTGSNTTSFLETGNLILAGTFSMGIGDVLELIYRKSTDNWHEVSRSEN